MANIREMVWVSDYVSLTWEIRKPPVMMKAVGTWEMCKGQCWVSEAHRAHGPSAKVKRQKRDGWLRILHDFKLSYFLSFQF